MVSLREEPKTTGRTVALALGSGGARGFAHIGVLDVLLEHGYTVSVIAGSSMGALVGSMYAAGQLQPFREWATSLRVPDVAALFDPVLPSSAGMVRGEKITAKITEFLHDLRIEDLPIPFTAVASDLTARREVWFQEGPIVTALRASFAIPGVFLPIVVNGRLLVDGGLLNPVPVEPTTARPSELTVAVSLAGNPGGAAIPVRESSQALPIEQWWDGVRRGAAEWLGPDFLRGKFGHHTEVAAGRPYEYPDKMSLIDVTGRSLEAMEALIERYRLASHPTDVKITIPVDSCLTLEFHRAQEMIDLGRRLAEQALAQHYERTGTSAPSSQTKAIDS